jgi:hypothetical protein
MGISGSFTDPMSTDRVAIKDTNAATTFKVNSPAGEYAILYVTNSAGDELKNPTTSDTAIKAGLLFYQAGIAVITASVFQGVVAAFCCPDHQHNSSSL